MAQHKSNSKGKVKRDQKRQSTWDECNSYDRLDASRHIGYHRREYEDSQFGSYPMHDDYSEDSFPDESPYEDEF